MGTALMGREVRPLTPHFLMTVRSQNDLCHFMHRDVVYKKKKYFLTIPPSIPCNYTIVKSVLSKTNCLNKRNIL